MEVAVYSGSFNPFHKGHLAVLRYLLDEGGFAMVYLIVSPQNPFKDSSLASSGRDRLEAVREAVKRHALQDRVKVEDIEFSMPFPSYTVRTLDALARREPDRRFTLVVGGDNLNEIPDWKEGWRILSDYGAVVYPRTGYDIAGDLRTLESLHRGTGARTPLRIRLLENAPRIDVSSTEIREKAARGEDVSALLA